MATRRYEQHLRAQSAEDTRRRILDAVEQHLRASPSEPVRVDAVARTAGVARSTVYVVFGSRTGLFDAFARHVAERAGLDRLLEAVRHPDVREHMRGGIRAGAEMFAADRDVMRALYSMAALDAEAVGGAVERTERGRAEGMARLAQRLEEAGALRPGVDREQAAHALWVITSFDAFDLLFTGRSLPLEEVIRALTDMAEAAVCA